MTNARIETELRNPIDSLRSNAKKIAKLFSQMSGEQMLQLIADSLEEYNRPLRRIVISRKPQIEAILKELGYDPKAANPAASLKPAKVFRLLTEVGGNEAYSFNTIFMGKIMLICAGLDPTIKLSEIECNRQRELTYQAIDKRLKKEEEINDQKIQFKLAEEKRLKEEESLLKTQLEKAKCENELTELNITKSEKSAELKELEEERQEREVQVSALQEKLRQYEQDEMEKQIQLDKTQRDLEEKKAAFEEIRKQHEYTHIDFNYEGFTSSQLKECNESARQAFQQNVAVINGKIKISNELSQLNLNSSRAKVISGMLSPEMSDEELKVIRAARNKDMADLIRLRQEEMLVGQPDDKVEKLKRELSLCLRLGQNKAAQTKIEAEKREISLQNEGFYTTLHDVPAATLTVQENYLTEATNSPASNLRRKLEKKPVPKFSQMKMKHGVNSGNKEMEKAFDKLNSFFGGRQTKPSPRLEESIDGLVLKL